MIRTTIRECSLVITILPGGVLCGLRIMIRTGIGVPHLIGRRTGIRRSGEAAGIPVRHITMEDTVTAEAGDTGTAAISQTREEEAAVPYVREH